MPKYGASSAVFLVDGYNMLAGKLKTLSMKHQSLTELADGMDDLFEKNLPTNKQRATVTQGGGFFDTATNSMHAAMADKLAVTPQTAKRVAVFGCMGQSVGAVCYGFEGLDSVEYEPLIEDGKLTKANASHMVTGQINRGQIVQPLATKTADWNTKTLGTVVDYALDPSQYKIPIASATKAGTCVVTTTVPHGRSTGDIVVIANNTLAGPAINGERTITVLSATTFSVAVDTSGSSGAGTGGTFVRGNSTNGAVGIQQITARSGFTNFVGKLRDSADDTTYADLISFTDVVAGDHAAERLTVSGVVDRYISYDGNVTGAGSIDAFAMVART